MTQYIRSLGLKRCILEDVWVDICVWNIITYGTSRGPSNDPREIVQVQLFKERFPESSD